MTDLADIEKRLAALETQTSEHIAATNEYIDGMVQQGPMTRIKTLETIISALISSINKISQDNPDIQQKIREYLNEIRKVFPEGLRAVFEAEDEIRKLIHQDKQLDERSTLALQVKKEMMEDRIKAFDTVLVQTLQDFTPDYEPHYVAHKPFGEIISILEKVINDEDEQPSKPQNGGFDSIFKPR